MGVVSLTHHLLFYAGSFSYICPMLSYIRGFLVLHTSCHLTGEFLLCSLLLPFKCKLFPFDQFAHQTAVFATQPSVVLILLWLHDGRVVMLEAFCW